jgi:ABC-type taurine transport system ATPase subunit
MRKEHSFAIDLRPGNREHLSVFDNIAFGLQLRGVSKQDIRKRVER